MIAVEDWKVMRWWNYKSHLFHCLSVQCWLHGRSTAAAHRSASGDHGSNAEEELGFFWDVTNTETLSETRADVKSDNTTLEELHCFWHRCVPTQMAPPTCAADVASSGFLSSLMRKKRGNLREMPFTGSTWQGHSRMRMMRSLQVKAAGLNTFLISCTIFAFIFLSFYLKKLEELINMRNVAKEKGRDQHGGTEVA